MGDGRTHAYASCFRLCRVCVDREAHHLVRREYDDEMFLVGRSVSSFQLDCVVLNSFVEYCYSEVISISECTLCFL